MKKFKTYISELNLNDFEEDVLKETPPNTADAMKSDIKQVRLVLPIKHILKQKV
jgi:hypothetical protein